MEKLNQAKRDEMPKQMPLRRSLAALTFVLCTLGTTGCSNTSLEFKGPSVTYTPSPGSLEASGDKKYQAGDYPGAINDYDQLIERYPEIPRGYTRRSAARGKLGLLKEALEDANMAIELGTDDAWAYNNHAVLLLRSSGTSPKSLEEALESANKAIAIDSAIPTFYFNRAIIKYNMNDLDGAMTDHSRTLELDENYSDALRERGSLFAELGIVPSACADWKKASSLGDKRSTDYLQENSAVCKEA